MIGNHPRSTRGEFRRGAHRLRAETTCRGIDNGAFDYVRRCHSERLEISERRQGPDRHSTSIFRQRHDGAFTG